MNPTALQTETAAIRRIPTTDGDHGLLERCLDGDAASLDELMARHWAPIVDYVSTLLNSDRDEAKDIAQDLFLRLWENRLAWRPTGSVRGFLFGVARNLARNRTKWRAVRTEATGRLRLFLRGGHRPRTPLELLEVSEQRAYLHTLVDRLPARRREVFLLVRVHGFSYKEVAETLDLSTQTVANHVSAALSDLRRMLDHA